MAMSVSHGMFKSQIGSSRIVLNNEVVFVVVPEMNEKHIRESDQSGLSISVEFHSSTTTRNDELFISYLIKSVLNEYLIKEIDEYRQIRFEITANTTRMSIIGNAVLVACLDAGLPLRRMFYCVGDNNFYIVDINGIKAYYINKENEIKEENEIKREIEYIKESIEYAMQDMIKFKE